MHLRKNTIRTKSGVYVYSQIVESFRRVKDGMPSTRVVANLGQIAEIQHNNLQRAFEASKDGKTLVVSGSLNETTPLWKPTQNLAYLDVSVIFELWKSWRLDEVFRSLIAKNSSDVGVEKVIAGLVIHRCVDPDSKLSATRWFPRTALPELLGLKAESFNNSRIHRSLERLEGINASLMARLPSLYQKEMPIFGSLFLDVSDTWFVGHGPKLSALGKTKEGMLRKKIGIVLLVNEDGFPLRWDTVSGAASDCNIMTAMLNSIKRLSWLGEAPLVCDRAMGKTAQLSDMYRMDIKFLTAITRTEFSTYAPNLASISLDNKTLENADKLELTRESRAKVRELAFKEIDENLFVIDYGCIEKSVILKSDLTSNKDDDDYVARAIRLCQEILRLVADKKFSSYRAAAASVGLGRGLAGRYLRLRYLPLDIQEAILNKEVHIASIDDLIHLTKLKSTEEIAKKFEEISQRKAKRPSYQPSQQQNIKDESFALKVRVIAYFNPEMFADKKLKAQRLLARVKCFEDDLNSRLSTHGSCRAREKIASEVDRFLRRDSILEAFNVEISEINVGDKKTFRVKLNIKKDEWSKRRRHDGFCVLVFHPKLNLTAEKAAKLYREKNTVEIDFRTIKSTLEIRPIYHHTDEKIKAHVTVCMLSLLLERTLRKKMGKHGTAQQALETLETCHLNRYAIEKQSLYSTTCIDEEQKKILKHLNMNYLVDDDLISEKITPRS